MGSEQLHNRQIESDRKMYNDKQRSLKILLQKTAREPFKTQYYKDILNGMDVTEFEALLEKDGTFRDLEDGISAIMPALKRLANIAEKYHWYSGKEWGSTELKRKFLAATARYCKMEADRKEMGRERFHDSIFRIPGNAINIFYALLPDMISVEDGNADLDMCEVYQQIYRVGMQPWTLPLRNDATDENPISVERFRNHIWWISANGIDYRPLVYSALMFRNVEMMDVLVEVCIRALSPVSAEEAGTSFWSEGFCADGFGWGHGRQSYNTGYPAHGMRGILNILSFTKGTPWERELDRMNVDLVMNFIRSMTWGEYKEFSAPMQTRGIFQRNPNAFKEQEFEKVRSSENNWGLFLADSFLSNFRERLPMEYLEELSAYLKHGNSLKLTDFEEHYKGVRYFWNNDSLIKKTDKMYLYVNMASSRRDGVEFADCMADKRNYFTADGSYVLMKTGDEYRDVMGTWHVSDLPGITQRKLKNEELKTETNWHGYRSKHNFAAGIARGGNGAAGFIFEKDDIREPDGAGIIYDDFSKEILGIQAYKSYFVIGETVMCLGAGITDVMPEYGKEIHTTVNNTMWKNDICVLDNNGNIQEYTRGIKVYMVDQNPLYVKQGDVLYGILPRTSQRVEVCGEVRRTHWYDLNEGNRNVEDIDVPIFEMAIYHGVHPVNSSYAYFMYCGEDDYAQYLKKEQLKVIANSNQIQAVSSANGDVVQAIVYNSNAVLEMEDYKVRLSAPGAIMIEKDETEKVSYITVCDGEQNPNLTEMVVSIQVRDDDWAEVRIALLNGSQCGAPITFKY